MRMVCQRVSEAKVDVDGRTIGQIGPGLLVYLSIGKGDTITDAQFMAEKITGLRIFADEHGKMNKSVKDVGGRILIISNFTLHGDCRKGRRPGFDAAADPPTAEHLYEKTVELVRQQGITVETGIFAAHMQVASVNDGPLNFILDSQRLF